MNIPTSPPFESIWDRLSYLASMDTHDMVFCHCHSEMNTTLPMSVVGTNDFPLRRCISTMSQPPKRSAKLVDRSLGQLLDLQRPFQESIGFTDGRVSIKNDMFKACAPYGPGVPGGNSCLMRLIAGVYSQMISAQGFVLVDLQSVLVSIMYFWVSKCCVGDHLGPTLGVSCGKVLVP